MKARITTVSPATFSLAASPTPRASTRRRTLIPSWKRLALLGAAVLCAVAFGASRASAANNCSAYAWNSTFSDYITVCTYTGGSMGATSRWFYIYGYYTGYRGYFEQNLSGYAVFWCPVNGSCSIVSYWR